MKHVDDVEKADEARKETTGEEQKEEKRKEAARNLMGFFLMGLLNNVTYVMMNAGAGDIVPGEYAVIYLCNIAPSMVVKLTGPYWFHLLSYKQRILVAAACVASCYVLVNHFETKWIRLLGVSLGAIQGGMGEATMLAMSQFYSEPKKCLVYFSSGTGFAGPAGYFISLVLLPAITLHGVSASVKNIFCTFLGEFVVVAYLVSFFLVLEAPWIDKIREAAQETMFGGGRRTSLSLSFSSSSSLASPLLMTRPDENDVDEGKVVERLSTAGDALVPPPKVCVGADPDENSTLTAPRTSSSVAVPKLMKRVVSVADTLSTKERFSFICGLWPYMAPLFIVYVSEYALQSGVWTAFALPSSRSGASDLVKDKSKRDFAYKALNLTYQIGVFVSRSSGLLFQPNVATLWAMPTLQCGFWILFYAIAVSHFWYGFSLLVPAFVVGLLGGAVYVNAFTLIDKNLLPEYRELALSATAFACDAGILIGNICGLFCQFCLFDAMDIKADDVSSCPFR